MQLAQCFDKNDPKCKYGKTACKVFDIYGRKSR